MKIPKTLLCLSFLLPAIAHAAPLPKMGLWQGTATMDMGGQKHSTEDYDCITAEDVQRFKDKDMKMDDGMRENGCSYGEITEGAHHYAGSIQCSSDMGSSKGIFRVELPDSTHMSTHFETRGVVQLPGEAARPFNFSNTSDMHWAATECGDHADDK